ncbi:hypothetical protein CFO_g5607 [Ceratocystis platani]|uniref:Uncharacterized protein n=1 Tax=Ceratocystis fimbriata f. sp. platani TaxID=88771 RepID=A0A0F8AW54_CERFI|nr:hypothetical protein CFO_g5607 [Ceratocystis platani]
MGPSLTKEERVKKVQNVIEILDTHQIRDEFARDMLVDEFGDWTVDDWRDLGGKYHLLRSNLILHGLYVPHHRITGSMMNSIEVASRSVNEWTDEMMKQYDEIPTVFTGNSALQERLTKRKVPRELWNVSHWTPEAETQGTCPTQEWAVRGEQAKQGKGTKGTQDVREEYRQGSATMADKVEGGATNRSMVGVEQEKTGGIDFADFEYRTPSLRNNAYEIEQRGIIGLLETAWPKESQYSGTIDTVSLWRCFQLFVHKCRQLGLEEHYLHDALTCMMAPGNVRDYCAELVCTTAATDWKSVMTQMEQRFENEGVKLARDNRWLRYTLDEFIRDKGDGRPMHEIVFAYFEWLETGQRSVSSVYHGHHILRDRLLANLRQHHATARESSRYGYSNMTALDVATHVCDALRAELLVATVEKRGSSSSRSVLRLS